MNKIEEEKLFVRNHLSQKYKLLGEEIKLGTLCKCVI